MDKHVGSRLRMRRKMLDMSQGELADALGIRGQQVQKYEVGTNRVGASRLQQIANILGVPITFFFETARAKGTASHKVDLALTTIDDFLGTSEGLALIRAFRQIDDANVHRGIVHLVEEIGEIYSSKGARRKGRRSSQPSK